MRTCLLGLPIVFLLLLGTVRGETPIRFTDTTEESGIDFVHNNGAFGEKYLPETMGAGVAVFDVNGDGALDLFFVNGRDWPGHTTGRSQTPALYLQEGGRFVDRTREAGLDIVTYGMGVAVGDYDNDGDADLYLTSLDEDRLFRNEGDGTFIDVTRQAGIENPDFAASAAWFDADNDGLLDLYVTNYVEWTIDTDLFCTLDGVNKSYCTPESYNGVSDRLFRNNGNGTFTDITREAGLFDPTSKSLGVVAFDVNDDGAIDLFVSNDTEPDKLYENRGNGTFEEIGMLSGVAFDAAGVARAGMGVDVADFDRSGRFGIAVGNFSNEMMSLYRNEGNGLFIDAATQARMGPTSLLTLGFGVLFFDADGDGWLDLFVANGHVENEINRVQPNVFYAEPPHLFWNRDGGTRFEDIAEEAGLAEPLVGRGAAYGDLDGDGDLDLVLTSNGGPARIYRNDSPPANLLRIRLAGTRSNRDAVGAIVAVTTADGTQRQIVRGGGSYCSQSERTLTFGLGSASWADRVDVRFPSGRTQSFNRVDANQTVEVTEGEGITERIPFVR